MPAKTDQERRSELERTRRRKVDCGDGHNNECLADSILQLLSFHGFVSATLLECRAERRRACAQCRNHLVTHVNSQLHPIVRTANGCEDRSASDDEHARAFLQHDNHAETIIRFFLAQPYATGRAMSPCGMKIRVYTRWDSPTLDPDELARVIGRVGNSGDPVVLDLYNNTGNGYTGFHLRSDFPLWAAGCCWGGCCGTEDYAE